ncbi:MAG TPA: hypothetical protein VK923_05155, partial [Euzebyales bacterium]|nr:hypothetical protein [Euzebyales bacterium]
MDEVVDPEGLDPEQIDAAVTRLLDVLDAIDAEGWYAALEVERPWSEHNPRISGEFARPAAVRRYLHRELTALL